MRQDNATKCSANKSVSHLLKIIKRKYLANFAQTNQLLEHTREVFPANQCELVLTHTSRYNYVALVLEYIGADSFTIVIYATCFCNVKNSIVRFYLL